MKNTSETNSQAKPGLFPAILRQYVAGLVWLIVVRFVLIQRGPGSSENSLPGAVSVVAKARHDGVLRRCAQCDGAIPHAFALSANALAAAPGLTY